MAAIRSVIGDMFSSTFCVQTAAVVSAGDLHGSTWAPLAILTFMIFFYVSIFTVIFGAASFNPTGNVAFYVAGIPGVISELRLSATMHLRLLRLCLITIFLVTLTTEISAAPVSVLTINSPDGDIIDCVTRETQPTLSDPFFQNHTIQEIPTNLPNIAKLEDQFGWQIWHRNGTRCPHGSIPMRRIDGITGSQAGVEATKGHEYVIASVNYTSPPQIYGTRATMSVMHPAVERPQEFSLGQIWVKSGSYDTNDLNTIEAGWQTDAYTQTRCYNIRCPGFVQISSTVLIEGAISTTSTFGGPQTELIIQIWKDVKLELWWLGVGLKKGTVLMPVGYWPTEIFTRLLNHADDVQWGGEIVNINISGRHTTTQMGSGYFPNSPKVAYMYGLQLSLTKDNLQPVVRNLEVAASNPDYYKGKKLSDSSFSYGGPVHDSSVYYGPYSIFICFSLSLFLLF